MEVDSPIIVLVCGCRQVEIRERDLVPGRREVVQRVANDGVVPDLDAVTVFEDQDRFGLVSHFDGFRGYCGSRLGRRFGRGGNNTLAASATIKNGWPSPLFFICVVGNSVRLLDDNHGYRLYQSVSR